MGPSSQTARIVRTNGFVFGPFLEIIFCFLALAFPASSSAYIYVQNETYASLPALFGRFLLDGKTYQARLQYFHDNPYLCDVDDNTKRKFVPPTGPSIPDAHGGNLTLTEPVILMAGRGNCPFQRKAAMAETIHDSIRFLLVFNFDMDGTQDEVLVPMYSQFGNTRLVLLSVSHATGQALKLFLSQQSPSVTALGGPLIEFDSEPPLGILTAADLQSMMLSALGLFFMLISFTGCLVILAGTYSQIAAQQQGGPLALSPRRLLTQDEVHQLTADTPEFMAAAPDFGDLEASTDSTARIPSSTGEHDSNSLDRNDDEVEPTTRDQSSVGAEEHVCSVCLDDFEDDTEITALPCRHTFHTDCILPWLTERQSKCPLCKFDVLQHIREQQNSDDACGDAATAGRGASWWDRARRYRWTSVEVVDHHHHHHHQLDEPSQSNNDLHLEREQEDPMDGVELTEQRQLS